MTDRTDDLVVHWAAYYDDPDAEQVWREPVAQLRVGEVPTPEQVEAAAFKVARRAWENDKALTTRWPGAGRSDAFVRELAAMYCYVARPMTREETAVVLAEGQAA